MEATVIFIDTQPYTITYLINGKMVRYTADIFVVYIDNTGEQKRLYIEVKPSRKLATTVNNHKFNTLKALYIKFGREFRTFNELDITRTKLKNLELLFQGASVFGDVQPDINKMLAILPKQTTLGDAHQQIINAGLHENHIHYLLFEQYYCVDMDHPLTQDCLIYLNVT